MGTRVRSKCHVSRSFPGQPPKCCASANLLGDPSARQPAWLRDRRFDVMWQQAGMICAVCSRPVILTSNSKRGAWSSCRAETEARYVPAASWAFLWRPLQHASASRVSEATKLSPGLERWSRNAGRAARRNRGWILRRYCARRPRRRLQASRQSDRSFEYDFPDQLAN